MYVFNEYNDAGLGLDQHNIGKIIYLDSIILHDIGGMCREHVKIVNNMKALKGGGGGGTLLGQ